MRILRVAQKAYPEHGGGGAYHVHALSRDQAASGHDVTLLTVGEGPQTETRDGYRVLRVPGQVSILGNEVSPQLAKSAKRLLASHEVVHAHSHLYFSTNIAAGLRKFTDTPLAITNHGLYSQTVSKRLFGWYLKSVGRWTYNSADKIFCYTKTDRRRLRNYGITTDVDVVPNGIDTTRFTPEGNIHEMMPDGPTVLFVGRLVDGKRPSDALEAFAALAAHRPGLSLVFVGKGPRRQGLAERAQKLGVSESVRFTGHLPPNQMASVYRGADVLVLPSRSEGLPRTLMEAMACGIVPLSSDLPQLRELIDRSELRFELGNSAEISAAIEAVLDEELGADSEWARRKVSDEHDWSRTVAETTASLSSLC